MARLPNADEAELIRRYVGVTKRPDLSAERVAGRPNRIQLELLGGERAHLLQADHRLSGAAVAIRLASISLSPFFPFIDGKRRATSRRGDSLLAARPTFGQEFRPVASSKVARNQRHH
jgi:hypothetical protein